MINHFKPPTKVKVSAFDRHRNARVFLAGSIEMGKAVKWQDEVVDLIQTVSQLEDGVGIDFFNPRRDDWDSTWVQSITNPQFSDQVNWELTYIERADIVFFYFQPGTMSPISLLELGLVVGSGFHTAVIVVCPEGYERKGNVDIVCQRNNIKVHDTLLSGIHELKIQIEEVNWRLNNAD